MNSNIPTGAQLKVETAPTSFTVLQLTVTSLAGLGLGMFAAALLLHIGGLLPFALLLVPTGVVALGLAALLFPDVRTRSAATQRSAVKMSALVIAGAALAFGTAMPPVIWSIHTSSQSLERDAQAASLIWSLNDNGGECRAQLAATDAWEPVTLAGATAKEASYRALFDQDGGGCLSAEGLFARMPALIDVGYYDLDRRIWPFDRPADAQAAAERLGISAHDWCMATSMTHRVTDRANECAGQDDTTRLTAPPASYIKAEA